MKIMFSVGETSADLYAAQLAIQLQKINPQIEMFGMGGNRMEENGINITFNAVEHSVMGFTEIIKKLALFKKVLNQLLKEIEEKKPEVLVLMDFPGFNTVLGEKAQKLGVKVVYFCSPQAWAWKKKRAYKIAKWINTIASIFPFEAEIYKKAGANVVYVGHPLVDLVKSNLSRTEFCSKYGLNKDKKILAFLPGSRRQEITKLFPTILESAKMINASIQNIQYVVPVANEYVKKDIEAMALEYQIDLKIIEKANYDVMKSADFLIVKSGTSTLEVALLEKPMVIIYKVSKITAFIGRMLVHLQYYSLPNIILNKEVVPELIQEKAVPNIIANESIKIMNSQKIQDEQIAQLKTIKATLGNIGVFERTADLIYKIAKGEK